MVICVFKTSALVHQNAGGCKFSMWNMAICSFIIQRCSSGLPTPLLSLAFHYPSCSYPYSPFFSHRTSSAPFFTFPRPLFCGYNRYVFLTGFLFLCRPIALTPQQSRRQFLPARWRRCSQRKWSHRSRYTSHHYFLLQKLSKDFLGRNEGGPYNVPVEIVEILRNTNYKIILIKWARNFHIFINKSTWSPEPWNRSWISFASQFLPSVFFLSCRKPFLGHLSPIKP